MNGEILKLYHEDNLYILGKWFAREKNLKGFSTRGLSRASNITTSLISDIENQKVRPNLETIRQLYKEVGITFISDENHLASIQENILSLYYAVYDQNHEAINTFFVGLQTQISPLKYSPITIDIIIIEALVATLVDNHQVPDAFYALKNHLPYLSVIQKERYFIALGYQQIKEKEYPKALDSLHQAISLHREGRGFAVAHELISVIHSRQFEPLKAIEYSAKASRLHAKWSNIIRKIATDFIQIKSYLEVNQTDQAELLIRNLSYVLVESNQKQWYELKSFEAYLYYKKGLYEKSLSILESIPQRHFYLEILSLQVLINLQKTEEVEALYLSLMNQHPKPTDQLENAIIQMIYHQNKQEPQKALDEASSYLLENIEQLEELDALKDIVEFGMNYSLLKEDLKSLEDWVKLSQKLMKFDKIRP